MPASVAFFSASFKRVGSGQGNRNAVYLLVDGLLDQLRLPASLRIGGVKQFNVVLRGRLLGALPDRVPEGVTGGSMGDQRDLHPLRCGDLAAAAAASGVGGPSTGA